MAAVVFVLVSAASAPNILLITVDTLRADRLGCYGYAYPTTPHVDQLAARSLLFEDMLVEEPQTGPSLISMFTSQFPRVTGTIRNAVPLAEGIPTTVARFREAGYQTGAVVSNWNLKRDLSNLAGGFETYDDDFGRNFLGMARKERDAEEISDAAIAWMAERDSTRPLFYWVHYIDPHGPYEFRGRFNPRKIPLNNLSDDDALDARYDSEVAYADHHIGRLLEVVPRENTYIVFTADHGESLMEHDYLGHTREIYQTTMRVPLLISGPRIEPGKTPAPARGVDIGPTLLALADLPPLPSMSGVDVLTQPPDAARTRVFETYDGDIPRGEDARAELADRAPSRQGVVKGNWKLILREGKRLLFDLKNDPEERENVIDANQEIAAELAAEIERWNEMTPRNAAKSAELSETDREALEALGYIE